jgi:putative ABC transport system permease protein
MFQHNLLIALRNLRRHKGSFFINLIGLSTGLACAFLIYLWVSDELSVDKFHKNDSQLYQVMEISKENGNVVVHDGTQGPLAEAMEKDLPEVVSAVQTFSMSKVGISVPLKTNEKTIKTSGLFAGKNFFSVFSFKLKEGNADKVLAEKPSIVLSENLAISLFGSAQASMGKSLDWEIMGTKERSIVTGVFENPEHNSMKFDFAVTSEVLMNDFVPNFQKWWNEGVETHVLLKRGTDITQFNKKIENFVKRYFEPTHFTLFVRQYSSAYLHGNYENGVQSGGRIEYVKLFSIIAVFILIIACINFMNLSTAKASRRLKEVGIKKAIGSTRAALVFQFLSEAIFMAFVSLAAALILVALVMPVFNEITGKQIQFYSQPRIILVALLITLLTGMISGSYPAFYMSGFNVISVFRGKLKNSVGELLARKGLVVFQFMVSLVLMVAVMVIYKQIRYEQTKNIGYDRDNIVYFDKDGSLAQNAAPFIEELKKLPGVINASAMQETIFQNEVGSSTYGIDWPGKNDKDNINFVIRSVDYGLLETLGMKIKEGRSFSKEYGADSSVLVFNETAIKAMRLKDPVGTKVKLWGTDMTIAGVIKDFHMTSFHQPIQPLVFRLKPQQTSTLMVKMKAGEEKPVIAEIEALFKKFNPTYVFQYKFLDEAYQEQYISEERVSVLSRYFAGLAILISCLGLFGLAAFNAEVRTKEIGIRKVLGATAGNVVMLLSKDFIALIIISMLIAFPLAWWAMSSWLDRFAYRINIDAWVFIFAGSAMIILAVITIGYQSLKSALMNPVGSLRTE